MRTVCLALAFAALAQSAEFHSGQAARAVIGQPSFSAHEAGVTAYALALGRGKLYAAEAERLLTFDIARPCVLCGATPEAVMKQGVVRGVAAVAVSGKTVVVADAANRRVLIWKSALSRQPDVTLTVADPISAAYDGRRLFVGDGAQHKVLVWNALPASDDQPADAVLGQSEAALGAATIGTPSALVSDGTNLFVADTEHRRILVFTPGDVALAEDAVVNAASLEAGALAPGTLITIRAMGLAGEGENPEVYLNGEALPVLEATPEEIQAQAPYDLGNATAGSLYIRNGAAISSAVAVRFAAASPGIFAVGTKEPRSGLLLRAVGEQEADGGPMKGEPISRENPAAAGEAVTVWATGLGLVDAGDARAPEGDTVLAVHALVNGEPAEVLSARLPHGAAGVYEVVIQLPPGLTATDEARLQLMQNAIASNTVIFPVIGPR